MRRIESVSGAFSLQQLRAAVTISRARGLENSNGAEQTCETL